ncbi:MAG: geranylgeranyl reductase [Nitrospirales bacterium]|nr:MAG: geranylgeranyl reductase [Nitrospirales bacterium]
MTAFQSYDVIIVGMGPAGASAAYELCQAGLSVLGLEKQSHPRYKVCGGGLSARIESILPPDFHSVIEDAVHRMIFSYGPKESYHVESEKPIAYMVMRSCFDQWLVDRALHAGAVVHEDEPATALTTLPDGIEVRTAKSRYHGRVVIGADGAMSLVAQQLFPHRRLRKIPALESEILSHSPEAHAYAKTALISLNAAKKGYGWIFPKKQGLSIGVGEFVRGMNQPRQSFQQFTRKEPTLAEQVIPSPLGHPIPVFNRSPGIMNGRWNNGLVQGRALLVGDAGHLVDPLLGEGIYYAVRSGQLAGTNIVQALQHSSPCFDNYEHAVINEFGREFQIASRLGRVVYGVPRSWHRWVGKTFPGPYQGVLQRYCGMLQGQETYQTLWDRMMTRMKKPFIRRS